jgi:hypothetical protein
MVDFQPDGIVEAEIPQTRSNSRVKYLRNRRDCLNVRPDYAVPDVEERRQVTATHIAVLVNGSGENCSALLPVPFRIVRPATEE